jgi:hypothetical protein
MKASDFKYHRKTHLLGSAGAILALPKLEVNASTSEVPKRLVCAATFFGLMPEHFFPKQSGPLQNLPRLLKPIQSMKKHVTVFSGLDHNMSGGHEATKYFLSGIKMNDMKAYPEANISIDQKAANHIGSKTRYPSLTLGCYSNMENGISWTKNGNQIKPIQSITTLQKMLFENPSQTEIKREEYRLREKKSILDLVRDQAKRFESKLGKSDLDKLDQYYTSVRSLEKKIEQSKKWLYQKKPDTNLNVQLGADHLDLKQKAPLFYDLMILALQTDSTRVISLSFTGLGQNSGGLPGVQNDYHALSHHGQVKESIEELMIIESFFTSQFSRFLKKLHDIKEPNGKTLLDNTIALMGSGMSNANSHSNKNLPLLVSGGGYKHGQHIHLSQDKNKSRPLCDLYLNLLQNFGLEIDNFNLSKSNLNEFKYSS